jgi:hypothetical protein
VRSLSGHCLCGAVSYRCDAEPVVTALCHCDDCQHQTGTTFSIVVVVPSQALEIEGESLATYETVGRESGAQRERKFCSNCGSPIATLMADMPDLAVLKAGTLDDRSWLQPTLEIYGDSAQEWFPESDERRRFPGGIPAASG